MTFVSQKAGSGTEAGEETETDQTITPPENQENPEEQSVQPEAEEPGSKSDTETTSSESEPSASDTDETQSEPDTEAETETALTTEEDNDETNTGMETETQTETEQHNEKGTVTRTHSCAVPFSAWPIFLTDAPFVHFGRFAIIFLERLTVVACTIETIFAGDIRDRPVRVKQCSKTLAQPQFRGVADGRIAQVFFE